MDKDTQAIVDAIQAANQKDETKIIDDILADIGKRNTLPFDIVYVDLSIDRSTAPLKVTGAGTFIIAVDASSESVECSIGIGTNESNSQRRITLREGKRIFLPYTEFFIYHDAQTAGSYIKLLRGRELASLKLGIEDDSGTAAGDSVAAALGLSSTFSTAQVAVDGTADLIKAANSSRKRITITNTDAGADLFIGLTAAVTATTGHCIKPGASITINTTAAVYGITTGAAITVSYLEE